MSIASPNPSRGSPFSDEDQVDLKLSTAAQQLRESEAQYRILFKANPQPMWVFDLHSLKFLAVNKAAVRHYGYSEEEFLKMSLKDIRTPEGARKLDDELSVENRHLKRNTESIHLRKDGSFIDVEITASDIPFNGREARLVMANDITERKKLERQFLRAQRMESVGTLAGGIAHDLNNLLSPVLMGVDLLTHHNPDPESRKRILESIDKSARRGASLINQVLSFARGVEGARIPLKLGSIVREVESIVSNTFPKNIHLSTQIEPKLHRVEGDPTQLTQVLLNLCVNARDAMPRGGRLQIQLQNCELDLAHSRLLGLQAGSFIEIKVSDSGLGIRPENIQRIFDPFFTTKEMGKGTGLGLSTALGIIDSHGGSINVSSEPGQGTAFTVYLPAQTSGLCNVDSENPINNAPTPHGDGERILLVDDESAVRTITKKTLETYGYEVFSAKNGAKAIEVFAKHIDELDLVITDLMMPVMDGPALATAIRRINPSMPIIATSGLRLQTNLERRQIDTPHFLTKPYSSQQLLQIVHTALTADRPTS